MTLPQLGKNKASFLSQFLVTIFQISKADTKPVWLKFETKTLAVGHFRVFQIKVFFCQRERFSCIFYFLSETDIDVLLSFFLSLFFVFFPIWSCRCQWSSRGNLNVMLPWDFRIKNLESIQSTLNQREKFPNWSNRFF